jgi:hypothetical protein
MTNPTIDIDLIADCAAVWSALSQTPLTIAERCCCHTDDRFVMRWGGDNEEWFHVGDVTYAEMRHIHVDSSESDCDGRYDHGAIYTINSIRPEALRPAYLRSEGVPSPDFRDLWMYMVRHEPPLHGDDVTLHVHADRADWSYTTDEGGGGGQMQVCDGKWCDLNEHLFRDRTAERAGY